MTFVVIGALRVNFFFFSFILMVPFDTQDLNGVVYVWVGSKADHDDATLTEELAYVIFKVSIGSHRLEKYLNIEVFLEKSLKIKSALKSAGASLIDHEKYLNIDVFLEMSSKIKSA